VSAEDAPLPSLSDMHLSAVDNTLVSELLCAWGEVMDADNGEEYLVGEADRFRVQSDQDGLAMQDLRQSLPGAAEDHAGIVDYGAVTKTIVAHETALPGVEATPRFNHKLYYSSLRRFQTTEDGAGDWGNVLLYGDVVTSTNSLLEK
jgi:biotin--protein ligase